MEKATSHSHSHKGLIELGMKYNFFLNFPVLGFQLTSYHPLSNGM